MKNRTASVLGVAAVVAASLAITVTAPAASAAVGAGEDRQQSAQTSWWTYTNQTAAQVSHTLSVNKARLTDIRVTNPGSSQRFTVTEVANSGAYQSGWYWYYGLTPSDLVQKATGNNARITTLDCYRLSGATRCAAIMIANTGTNAEGWTAWVGSPAFIKSKVNPAINRMVSFSRVQGTSQYAAVFGSNTGTDKTAWWYYRGLTAPQILSKATANHARVVDLDRSSDTGTYTAIMYANPSGTPWYMYTGYSAAGLVNKALQLGQRLFDVTPYSAGGKTYYAGVMVNNANALSTQIIGLLASKVPNGAWGFELKEVGGATQAGVLTTKPFEPASALKVLYHYTSAVAEQAGTTTDSTTITYRYNPAEPNNKDICPDNYTSTRTTTLADADARMMDNSDNRTTRGILEQYGQPKMLAEAAHLGMTHTTIHHNIGCPTATTHNTTALADLAQLYSAYRLGTDITNPTWRTAFHDRMLNETNYPSAKTTICTIVKQEASSLGKSLDTANAFCAQVRWIAKGGSYQYGGNNVTSPISWANGSLTTLPIRGSRTVTSKAYFYGDFFDQVSFSTAAAKSALGTARSAAFTAAIRPYIRAALATW